MQHSAPMLVLDLPLQNSISLNLSAVSKLGLYCDYFDRLSLARQVYHDRQMLELTLSLHSVVKEVPVRLYYQI